MISSRLKINSGKLVVRPTPNVQQKLSASRKVTAYGMDGGTMFGPTQAVANSALIHNTTFLGIIPEYNENMLLTYYRDCYYYDAIAGATVDILSTFPFSDYSLTGLENRYIEKYSEAMARINTRSLLQEVSMSYLVDGAFIGSLVYNSDEKLFQDILIHDVANSTITQQPFYGIDPVVQVNTSASLQEFLNAGSPYIDQIMRSYPNRMVETFLSGSVILDPLTTLFMARKALRDRTHASYLKRLLPVYLLEKLLYRGTLVEANKRLRATTHITVGDDTWEPNNAEMSTILADFQRSEMDPLGAWVVTRNGVNVTEVRPGGDFWKWTDNIDTLTPFKLRALGISEAFLSGDASYATAEAAISIFMDNSSAYRSSVTHRLFTNKMFPLIAVTNGLYKDIKKARKVRSPADLMFNLNNHKNLMIPEVRWHKALEGKESGSEFDMLEKLSEKGFVIPLKMWAAAAGIDLTVLLRDLEEDQTIKESIEKVTGLKAEEQGGTEEEDMSGEDNEGDLRFSFRKRTSIPTHAASIGKRSLPLLSRQFEADIHGKMSKSGNSVHHVVGEARHNAKMNDLIIKAVRALKDPNHRESVRKKVQEKIGAAANMKI